MKKGRISKVEEEHIRENIEDGYAQLAHYLDRSSDSILKFIQKKVAQGDLPEPTWLAAESSEERAMYDLECRPYFTEIQKQFSDNEIRLFKYHWARIISQFKDDVTPTEELQVVDLIKLELLMNRSLEGNQDNITQISTLEELIRLERTRDSDQMNRDDLFNMERQVASLRASQESLNRDYRDLQTKKNAMLKEMKATRDQRVQRFEDSKTSFSGWMAYLIANPELTHGYGIEMEKMRMAMEKEKERLSQFHKYTDGMVDQPFLTPETVRSD